MVLRICRLAGMAHLPGVLNTQLQSTMSPVAWPDNCQFAVASLLPHSSAARQASIVGLSQVHRIVQ